MASIFYFMVEETRYEPSFDININESLRNHFPDLRKFRFALHKQQLYSTMTAMKEFIKDDEDNIELVAISDVDVANKFNQLQQTHQSSFIEFENLKKQLEKQKEQINFERSQKLGLLETIKQLKQQLKEQHSAVNRKETDPSIYSSAHKSNKFYAFSKRMPEDVGDKSLLITRDVLNEPLSQIQQSINVINENKNKLPSGCQAIIQTTYGEVYINLFPNKTPKTVENFIQHSKNGYYDGMIFHRVQQGFMIQTGCPKGNGIGGDDKPFTVSMANAGPNTNTSQFFITVCPAPWLDDKHTIFGQVYKGMNIVVQISEVETDDFDKPLNDIKIIAIKIL